MKVFCKISYSQFLWLEGCILFNWVLLKEKGGVGVGMLCDFFFSPPFCHGAQGERHESPLAGSWNHRRYAYCPETSCPCVATASVKIKV